MCTRSVGTMAMLSISATYSLLSLNKESWLLRMLLKNMDHSSKYLAALFHKKGLYVIVKIDRSTCNIQCNIQYNTTYVISIKMTYCYLNFISPTTVPTVQTRFDTSYNT